MKNPITVKDLGLLNELCIYEQWAATKFRMLYEITEDQTAKEMFKTYCVNHSTRRDALLKYLKTNSKAGGNGNA